MLREGVRRDREVEIGREPTALAQAELPNRGPALEHDVVGTAREQALADHPREQVLLGERSPRQSRSSCAAMEFLVAISR